MNNKPLETYLLPLRRFLIDASISEIMINQPETMFIEKQGEMHHISMPELTFEFLLGLAELIAHHNQQLFNQSHPLLAATLPGGERVQIVIPPACEAGKIVFAIRKQTLNDMSLQHYYSQQALHQAQLTYPGHEFTASPTSTSTHLIDQQLITLLTHKQFLTFIEQAIIHQKTLLISGGTGSGKTTLLNACLKKVSTQQRIITLEDVRELRLSQPNVVNLLATRLNGATKGISMQQLVAASLRLRPDRIVMGEIRGAEALDFLQAAATGHPGSMASIHANDPHTAFMRMMHLIKLNQNMNLTQTEILQQLQQVIDIVIQIKRVNSAEGTKRIISHIYFKELQRQLNS
ncbi:MAG: P-type DNA transfer ATPase VirB11 [Gammaproteobacteria bacterium]